MLAFYRVETGPEYIELLRKPLELLFRRHTNRLPFVIIAGDFNYPFIDCFLFLDDMQRDLNCNPKVMSPIL